MLQGLGVLLGACSNAGKSRSQAGVGAQCPAEHCTSPAGGVDQFLRGVGFVELLVLVVGLATVTVSPPEREQHTEDPADEKFEQPDCEASPDAHRRAPARRRVSGCLAAVRR